MLSQFFPASGAAQVASVSRRRTYRPMDLVDHLDPGPTKRILSLDGGGVRSAISIAVLERIEALLKRRHGNHAAFRLVDYYDLIGGTSTGAILAAGLAAKGMTATELRNLYGELVRRVFTRGSALSGKTALRPQFKGKKLLSILGDVFGDTTLGDERIATGLAVVTKRTDTDATWILHNHPAGTFYADPPDRSAVGARHYPLANVVRASTASPRQFEPELLQLARHPRAMTGMFVDSGVTPYNNPTFPLFLLATLTRHPFRWKTGSERLLVTSIGAGSLCSDRPGTPRKRVPTTLQARQALESMKDGAEHLGEMLMQLISEPTDPQWLDPELGDLRNVRITPEPQCSYQRYQARLSAEALKTDFGLGLSRRQLRAVRNMSDRNGFDIAYEIGQAIADRVVREEHFPEAFNLGEPPRPATETSTSASVLSRKGPLVASARTAAP
jgi:hypothetical protein